MAATLVHAGFLPNRILVRESPMGHFKNFTLHNLLFCIRGVLWVGVRLTRRFSLVTDQFPHISSIPLPDLIGTLFRRGKAIFCVLSSFSLYDFVKVLLRGLEWRYNPSYATCLDAIRLVYMF